MVPEESPVREYEVFVFPVFETITVYEPPVPTLSSILYPVIGELLDGAVHERSIWLEEICVATRLVGGFGTVEDEEVVGVADTSFDAVLVPTEFIA